MDAAAVGGVVVTVGVADGDAPRVRDGVADVVAAPGVVVRPGIYRLDDFLGVGAIVWLDGSGAR